MRALPDVHFELVDARGSVAVVAALQEGRADVGFAFADVAYFAYRERQTGDVGTHATSPSGQLRGIAALHVAPVHLITRPGLLIRGVHDLGGFTVGTGEPRSGQQRIADMLLDAYDLGPESLHREALEVGATAEAIMQGRVDAAFRTSYYPDELIAETLGSDAHIVPIDGPIVERLSRAYPFVQVLSIPANTYPGQGAPLRTIGVQRLLVCRSDLDGHVVFELTRRLFEALPRLTAANSSSLRLMDLERAPATPIPLHAGAAMYYRVRELGR